MAPQTPLPYLETDKVRQKKRNKGSPKRKGLEEIVNESHRHATRNGGRARKVSMGQRKVNTKKENENNTEYSKNDLNPAHNSGNVSCATKEWPDYPDQPRH